MNWKKQLQNSHRSVESDTLAPQSLQLLDKNHDILKQFPFKVTDAFLQQAQLHTFDPLLRQIIPLAEEQDNAAGFVDDAVGDLAAEKTPGLIQKYHGRVLLIVTSACAIHCRYCFRRHFPYQDSAAFGERLNQAIDWISQQKDIQEVILSGGDPLTLSDDKLRTLCQRIDRIQHVERIRFHTRIPTVLPDRILEMDMSFLKALRAQVIFVLHVNHAQELGKAAVKAIQRLKDEGFLLLNQSVLLSGVNDSLNDLLQLSQTLMRHSVLPYYLHQLDKTSGTAHFEVKDAVAVKLHRQLQELLPGYMVPKLVREIRGQASKVPL